MDPVVVAVIVMLLQLVVRHTHNDGLFHEVCFVCECMLCSHVLRTFPFSEVVSNGSPNPACAPSINEERNEECLDETRILSMC